MKTRTLILVAAMLLLTRAQTAIAEPGVDVTSIAGRSISQWAKQLDDQDRVVRLRALRSLAAFGSPAQKELAKSLDHEDAAMRYVAAVALGDIGGDVDASTKKRLIEMTKSDPSFSAKNAAAYSLCRAGMIEDYLPQLLEATSYPQRGVAVAMIDLIGRIGHPASPALDTLKRLTAENPASGKGDYHIGGAATQATRKIEGDVR